MHLAFAHDAKPVGRDPDLWALACELVVERFPTDIVYAPARAGDVHPAMVSSERARRELGWSAEMPFEQGVAGLMDEASAD